MLNLQQVLARRFSHPGASELIVVDQAAFVLDQRWLERKSPGLGPCRCWRNVHIKQQGNALRTFVLW